MGKSQSHRGHKNVQCEISPVLVMINLYVKFNVHSTFTKQVIVLKVADRRMDGRASDDYNRHQPNFWLRHKKTNLSCLQYENIALKLSPIFTLIIHFIVGK